MQIKSNENIKLKLIAKIFKSNLRILSITGISIFIPFAVLAYSPSRRFLYKMVPVKYQDSAYGV